jgi:hypothetical protein
MIIPPKKKRGGPGQRLSQSLLTYAYRSLAKALLVTRDFPERKRNPISKNRNTLILDYVSFLAIFAICPETRQQRHFRNSITIALNIGLCELFVMIINTLLLFKLASYFVPGALACFSAKCLPLHLQKKRDSAA